MYSSGLVLRGNGLVAGAGMLARRRTKRVAKSDDAVLGSSFGLDVDVRALAPKKICWFDAALGDLRRINFGEYLPGAGVVQN